MDLITVLLVALVAVGIVACASAVWALREFALASRSTRTLTEALQVRIVPLLDKADVTVDALNAELLRIDILVSRFEDAADRVSHTANTLHDIANAPERLAEKMRSWRRRRGAQDAPAGTSGAPLDRTEDSDTSVSDITQDDQHVSEDRWQQIG